MDVKNAEGKVLGWLNKINCDNAPQKIGHIHTGQMLLDIARRIETKPLEKIEDLLGMFETMGYSGEFASMLAVELFEEAYEHVEARAQEKLEDRLNRFRNRAANRAKYVPEPIYKFYEFTNEQGTPALRWQFDRDLRSFGLMSLVVHSLYGPQEEPVAVGLLNQIAPDNDEGLEEWENGLDRFNQLGWAVSGERLAWNMKSPVWPLLCKAHPQAIDLSAYGHGLNAPVLPESYMENISVTFRKLTDRQGNDLCTDGSGWYHPDAPQMQEFIAKYGVVACQPRMINPDNGLFAKGTLFPSEDALDENGNPTICFDWLQIKGRWKALAKQRRAENAVVTVKGCYLGNLFAWYRPSRISCSFELLENIETNATTIGIVEEMVEQSMNLLKKRGLDGLVADVAKKDPAIKMMAQLCAIAQQQGIDIHAWQIPRVHEAIREKLGRRLYQIMQGGGLKIPSYVCRIDATVPKGHCVVSGMKPGQEVAAFRFPIILSQGLVTMKTIKAKPHHLVNGEMCPHTVIMNPSDLVTGMQGDDDGDVVGLTTDPRFIELFKHKLDSLKFHIEPKGVTRTMTTDSAEGLKYLQTDHRGIVGRCTRWRSRLLAVGDNAAARAVSISVQENIDQQKRMPEWSDIREAADLSKWTRDENGEYHFDIRFDPEDLEGGGFPKKLIKRWIDSRLIQAGCAYEITGENGEPVVKAMDPLWWIQPQGRRVDPLNWNVPGENDPSAQFENLVHKAARKAHAMWLEFGDEFLNHKGEVPMSVLLPVVFQTKGIPATPKNMTWREYLKLRNKAGISQYNNKMKAIIGQRQKTSTEEGFKAHMRSLNGLQLWLEEKLQKAMASGELTLDEIMTIWVMETTQPEGNINNALRVVCFDGSPVMQMLGIQEAPRCLFLYKAHDRLEKTMELCLAEQDPFEHLRKLVQQSTKHGDAVKSKEGERVEIHECPDCMETLQTSLVRAIRTKKTGRETQYLLWLHSELSK